MEYNTMSIQTPNHLRRRVIAENRPETKMTEEAHKDDCDIHRVMRKYKNQGVIDHVNQHKGEYFNYIDAPDYTEAQQAIARAQELFDSVPSKIRADMSNSPEIFIEFMQNPSNREAIEAYGLDASHLPVTAKPTTPVPVDGEPPNVAPADATDS